MSNAVTQAVSYIKNRIPKKVLELTFMRREALTGHLRRGTRSLDAEIIKNVIEGIVIPDCNRHGGTELPLYIGNLVPVSKERGGTVYKIPKDMTNGAEIIDCQYASFIDNLSGMGPSSPFGLGHKGYSHLSSLAALNMQTTMGESITGTSDCSVISSADNTIFITSVSGHLSVKWVLLTIENDQVINRLNPKSYTEFSKLCLYACKMYIYNNLLVELDQGYIEGGAEIGQVKNIVESYSDAADNYDDYLKDPMEVVLFLNDSRKKEEHLFMITGGRR